MIPLFVHWLLAAFVGYFIGMFAGIVFIRGLAATRAIWGFGALGFLIGLLIGLSESPLIAGALTGGFTLAGTIVGKLWDKPSGDTVAPPVPLPGGRAPSAASTSPVDLSWLLAVSAGTVLGVILGVGVRANGVLVFHEETIDAKLERIGLNPAERKAVRERLVKSISMDDVLKAEPDAKGWLQKFEAGPAAKAGGAPARPHGGPAISETGVDWFRVWQEVDKSGTAESALLNEIVKSGPAGLRDVIGRFRKAGRGDGEIVKLLRDLTGEGL